MKTIRIDAEVWERLQDMAVPFEDTPNSVLRRVLGLKHEIAGKASRRVRRGKQKLEGNTPSAAFREPIIEALLKLDGQAKVREVVKAVGEKLAEQLTEVDKEPLLGRGEIRWENAVRWQGYYLQQEGMLRNDSPRGIWELPEKGRNIARGAS